MIQLTTIMTLDKPLIKWHEVLGNPYRYGLHPAMLLGDYVQTRLVRTKGMSVLHDDPILIDIKFTRQYVLTWIAVFLIKKLQIQSLDQLVALVTESWKYYELHND